MLLLMPVHNGGLFMETLLFSNVVGDISIKNSNLHFNHFMESYLNNKITNDDSLLFIQAPGLEGDQYYYSNMIDCFKNTGIDFKNKLFVDEKTDSKEVEDFINLDNIIIFLMGGNPYTQMDIIKKHKLESFIRNYKGLVIGFCAGAINLSKYSIITTDEDFLETDSYDGLGRVSLIIEPHYNEKNDQKRNNELANFSKKYNQEILAIPDTSMVLVEQDNVSLYGLVYHIFVRDDKLCIEESYNG